MLIMLFLLSKIRLCLYKIAINYLLFPFFFAIYSFIYGQFFAFFVFLIHNNVYFEYTQRHKKDDNQRPQRLYI